MKRFVLTLILGSAALGIAAYTRAAAPSNPAQYTELTIEQVNWRAIYARAGVGRRLHLKPWGRSRSFLKIAAGEGARQSSKLLPGLQSFT